MKRIFSLMLALALFSTVAYANTIEIDTVNVSEKSITVNFNTDGLSEEDQVTVLTYKADSADAEATESNIKYIDQISKASNSSLTFNLLDTPAGTYQIKMGGTDINTPDSISITVESNMGSDVNFMKNEATIFSNPVNAPYVVKDQFSSFYVVKPEINYIAAAASVPALDGYTVKEYGIRLNSNNYAASVALTTESKFGILFTDADDEIDVTYTPYVIYEKAGETPVTFYGTTKTQKITFTK